MDKLYENYVYTRQLNLNLSMIKKSSYKMHDFLYKNFFNDMKNEKPIASTIIFSKYNLFIYPFDSFYDLYFEIQRMFREKLNDKTPYYIQAWLNLYRKGEFIDWHNHWTPDKKTWHGYYCVDCESSKTTYKIPLEKQQKIIDIQNKNNLLVMSRSNGDQHRTWPWDKNEPRITIAFDIVPSNVISNTLINHWIPI